jgi:hypothetical protein
MNDEKRKLPRSSNPFAVPLKALPITEFYHILSFWRERGLRALICRGHLWLPKGLKRLAHPHVFQLSSLATTQAFTGRGRQLKDGASSLLPKIAWLPAVPSSGRQFVHPPWTPPSLADKTDTSDNSDKSDTLFFASTTARRLSILAGGHTKNFGKEGL